MRLPIRPVFPFRPENGHIIRLPAPAATSKMQLIRPIRPIRPYSDGSSFFDFPTAPDGRLWYNFAH